MIAYPTPHIAASPGDFAKTVLMPGDPLRAQFIAETYLDNPRLVNNVRGVQGYTGTYRGTPVSVMASGMGMPSIGIYARELYEVYDVQTILRVGSAGALTPAVHLRDIVLGQAACTDSAFAGQFRLPGTFAPIAAYPVLQRCAAIAARQGLPYHVGNLLSSDRFYNDEDDLPPAQRSTPTPGQLLKQGCSQRRQQTDSHREVKLQGTLQPESHTCQVEPYKADIYQKCRQPVFPSILHLYRAQ